MITNEVRDETRRLYDYRCGYCGISEAAIGNELELDHFKPKSANGGDELENLVYCCTSCNRRKGSFWPEAGEITKRLLHPKADYLTLHLRQEENGWLIALTETGVFHIERFELNRPRLIALRQDWQLQQWKESVNNEEETKRQNLRAEIQVSAERIQHLFDQINRMLSR